VQYLVRKYGVAFPITAETERTEAGWCQPRAAALSPREFLLAHLESKENGREIPLERVQSEARPSGVPFGYEKVAPGIYKVQPQAELKAGERLPLRRECADGSMQAFRLWHRGSGISTGHNKCDSAGRAKG